MRFHPIWILISSYLKLNKKTPRLYKKPKSIIKISILKVTYSIRKNCRVLYNQRINMKRFTYQLNQKLMRDGLTTIWISTWGLKMKGINQMRISESQGPRLLSKTKLKQKYSYLKTRMRKEKTKDFRCKLRI